jgi:MoaA/NifB/PqqE/SkfB family radical SAM enzyme
MGERARSPIADRADSQAGESRHPDVDRAAPGTPARDRSPLRGTGLLTARRFVENAWRARFTQNRVLRPMIATYHVTSYCNLNCTYCEDFGLAKNTHMTNALLPREQAMEVVRIIRTGIENIIFTGGETLLHPHIEDVVEYAARLRFHFITLITNGMLLPKRERILPHVSRLVISLDSLDADAWDGILAARPGTAARIIATIERYARLQAEYGYRLVVNCVVMPSTIGTARDVMAFCLRNGVGFSMSPQGLDDQPHPDLADNAAYRALVEDVLRLKRAGHDALGSTVYLEHMLRFDEFQCYPTLNVRVLPNGDLVYPCRPIADRHDGRGGVAANLLEFERFDDAFAAAVRRYGQPPKGCRSCFQQCFAEPSLLIRRPWRALAEMRRYKGTAAVAPRGVPT